MKGFADAWRAVAAEEGGRVIERKLQPPLIELRRGHWATLADTVSDPTGSGATHTRFRTPYRPARDFDLRIAKRGPLDRIVDWFGRSGIRIGRAELDRRFRTRSSSRGLARSLLLGTRLGELLLAEEDLSIELRRPGLRRRRALGAGVREATVRYPRTLKEPDDLREAFELSWSLLGELERVGVAKPPRD